VISPIIFIKAGMCQFRPHYLRTSLLFSAIFRLVTPDVFI